MAKIEMESVENKALVFCADAYLRLMDEMKAWLVISVLAIEKGRDANPSI